MDLFRRWNRTLEAIAHLIKLEGLLGLREPIPKELRNALKEDSYLFQRYQADTTDFKSEEEFIKKNRFKRNMFTSMTIVYCIFIFIGVLLFYQAYLA